LVSPSESRRTLGVRISPDGGSAAESEYCVAQGRELAAALRSSTISRPVALLAYRSIISPKLEYPLAATTFNSKECNRIMSTYIPTILQKMGFPRNFPLAVAFGSKSDGGLGLHDPQVEQGLRQVAFFVGHTKQGGRTADLLIQTLPWCQHIAGVSWRLLEQPSTRVPHVPDCWIMKLREFLARQGLSIRLHSPPGMCNAQRVNDKFLMDEFMTHHHGVTLTRLNACRIYLRVTRLSDICMAQGQDISPLAIKCQSPKTSHQVKHGPDNLAHQLHGAHCGQRQYKKPSYPHGRPLVSRMHSYKDPGKPTIIQN